VRRLVPASLLLFLPLLLFFAFDGKTGEGPAISGKSLTYPKTQWTKVFPADITGVDMAEKTGRVVASTKERVYYFGDSRAPQWTAGKEQDWKHVQDVAVNQKGDLVFFQTDDRPKTHTEGMDLTMRLYDGQGKELWNRPNPRRYVNAMLSPSGSYIMTGELMHTGVCCYDRNLNRLWKKQIQFWYVETDPLEKFVFDGQGGRLYTMEGKQVWEFDKATKILSVSDNAEYVLAKHYASRKARNRIFLNARVALKKVELCGSGGCVSPDGTYTAYVNDDNKLVVYRTRELLENGPDDLPPLFSETFQKPWSMNLARDNRSLFIMGKKSALSSSMMLVDLTEMKKAWEKPVKSDLRTALADENNRHVVVKTGDNVLKKFVSY